MSPCLTFSYLLPLGQNQPTRKNPDNLPLFENPKLLYSISFLALRKKYTYNDEINSPTTQFLSILNEKSHSCNIPSIRTYVRGARIYYLNSLDSANDGKYMNRDNGIYVYSEAARLIYYQLCYYYMFFLLFQSLWIKKKYILFKYILYNITFQAYRIGPYNNNIAG